MGMLSKTHSSPLYPSPSQRASSLQRLLEHMEVDKRSKFGIFCGKQVSSHCLFFRCPSPVQAATSHSLAQLFKCGCSHCSFTHLCKIESVENKTVRVKYKLQRVQLQNQFKKGRHDLLQLRMGVRHFVCRPN